MQIFNSQYSVNYKDPKITYVCTFDYYETSHYWVTGECVNPSKFQYDNGFHGNVWSGSDNVTIYDYLTKSSECRYGWRDHGNHPLPWQPHFTMATIHYHNDYLLSWQPPVTLANMLYHNNHPLIKQLFVTIFEFRAIDTNTMWPINQILLYNLAAGRGGKGEHERLTRRIHRLPRSAGIGRCAEVVCPNAHGRRG